MRTLTPKPVSTKQLTWLPLEHRYIGDISDTNGFGRVFDDACDEGLTLVSAVTGCQVVFAVDRTFYDSEGNITHWGLVAVGGDAYSSLRAITVTIFND